MANWPDEDEKKQDSFEFDDAGQERAYISLDQARIQAMSGAREVPGEYGRFSRAPMAFEVVEASETEDFYEVTLSFRPQGEFTGTPGQEQFFIGKDGQLEHRQVVSLPQEERSGSSRRVPLLTAGILVIAIAGLFGAVIAFGLFDRDNPVSAPPAREASDPPSETPVPAVPPGGQTPTPQPAATLDQVASAGATPARVEERPPEQSGSPGPLPTPAPGTLPLLVFQNGLGIPLLGISGFQGVQDTSISRGAPSSVLHDETSVFVQGDRSDEYDSQVLLRFDLTLIPPDTEVSEAVLALHRHPNSFEISTEVVAYRLTGPVDLDQVTWDNFDRSVIGPEAGRFTVETLSEYGGSWHQLDILDLAREWLTSPDTNNGILLVHGGFDDVPEIGFFSSEYTSDGTDAGRTLTPRLIVRYGSDDGSVPVALTDANLATPTVTQTAIPTRVPTRTATPAPTVAPKRTPPRTSTICPLRLVRRPQSPVASR